MPVMSYEFLQYDSISVFHPTGVIRTKIELPGSKSESNRLLILKALHNRELDIMGLSESDDTVLLQKILDNDLKEGVVDCHMAGTSYRFLLAYFASMPGCDVLLTGAPRMLERPIGPLVAALRNLGADITYMGKDGYPPVRIQGKDLTEHYVEIDGSTSSQFISALMLIGTKMKSGLHIRITGRQVSVPYIYLTASTLQRLGFHVSIQLPDITILPATIKVSRVRVEPDWSAASYWYLVALLSKEAEIFLPGLRIPSMQGDSALRGYFDMLGVETVYLGSGIRLFRNSMREINSEALFLNFIDTPDIAQTIAVALAASGIKGYLTGLNTLRIKETNRIEALVNELSKFSVQCEFGNDCIRLNGGFTFAENTLINTYGDHRMAMAFAPLGIFGKIFIEHPGVVSKSYPNFWSDLIHAGFLIQET